MGNMSDSGQIHDFAKSRGKQIWGENKEPYSGYIVIVSAKKGEEQIRKNDCFKKR